MHRAFRPGLALDMDSRLLTMIKYGPIDWVFAIDLARLNIVGGNSEQVSIRQPIGIFLLFISMRRKPS